MKTIFILIFLFIFITLCQGQKSKSTPDGIRTITLNVQQSRRLRYHQVNIEISPSGSEALVRVKSKAACYDRKCLKSNIDTVYRIRGDAFFKIENAVKKISSSDIEAAQVKGLDGVTCRIGFKEDNKSVSYIVWSPNYKTQDRKLKAYLSASQLILKAAKLKERDIL